jgi:type II secretory pathway pseudopilin PulG
MIRFRHAKTARAFTLVEATLSTVVVAIMLVAALSTGSTTRLAEYKLMIRSQALTLAQDLMTEIRQQAYEDPNSPVFGIESGEQSADRTDFDDMDDYHKWSGAPPQLPDGNDLPNFTGWERRVQVEWVELTDLSQTSVSEQGVKRVIVTVLHDGVPSTSVTAYCTGTWPSLLASWSSN